MALDTNLIQTFHNSLILNKKNPMLRLSGNKVNKINNLQAILC